MEGEKKEGERGISFQPLPWQEVQKATKKKINGRFSYSICCISIDRYSKMSLSIGDFKKYIFTEQRPGPHGEDWARGCSSGIRHHDNILIQMWLSFQKEVRGESVHLLFSQEAWRRRDRKSPILCSHLLYHLSGCSQTYLLLGQRECLCTRRKEEYRKILWQLGLFFGMSLFGDSLIRVSKEAQRCAVGVCHGHHLKRDMQRVASFGVALPQAQQRTLLCTSV